MKSKEHSGTLAALEEITKELIDMLARLRSKLREVETRMLTLRKGAVVIGQNLVQANPMCFNLRRWIAFILARNKPDTHQDQKSER